MLPQPRRNLRTLTDADVAAIVAALVPEVRALVDAARRRPSPLSRADRARLARVLPAIVGALGSDPFVVNELAQFPAIRVVTRGLEARQIGRLLNRAAAAPTPIDGLIVERLGKELHRVIWRIVASS